MHKGEKERKMKDLQIFKNEEFGTVRTITVDNEPWFVGKDVCEVFGDTNYRRSLATLDEDEKGVSQMTTPGGIQNMTIINESGLYTLLFNMQPQKAKGVSQNEQAINDRIEKLKRFKYWVTHEVLPSIRKTGGYIAGQESLSDDELLTKALLVAQRKIEERNKLIASQKQIIGELTPKAEYVDLILNNKGLVTITQIAKDYGMSGSKLNRILADLRIQYKQSGQWMLYSEHQNKGWTHSKTINITRSDGRPDVVMETKWTQKGRLALYDLLKKKRNLAEH